MTLSFLTSLFAALRRHYLSVTAYLAHLALQIGRSSQSGSHLGFGENLASRTRITSNLERNIIFCEKALHSALSRVIIYMLLLRRCSLRLPFSHRPPALHQGIATGQCQSFSRTSEIIQGSFADSLRQRTTKAQAS